MSYVPSDAKTFQATEMALLSSRRCTFSSSVVSASTDSSRDLDSAPGSDDELREFPAANFLSKISSRRPSTSISVASRYGAETDLVEIASVLKKVSSASSLLSRRPGFEVGLQLMDPVVGPQIPGRKPCNSRLCMTPAAECKCVLLANNFYIGDAVGVQMPCGISRKGDTICECETMSDLGDRPLLAEDSSSDSDWDLDSAPGSDDELCEFPSANFLSKISSRRPSTLISVASRYGAETDLVEIAGVLQKVASASSLLSRRPGFEVGLQLMAPVVGPQLPGRKPCKSRLCMTPAAESECVLLADHFYIGDAVGVQMPCDISRNGDAICECETMSDLGDRPLLEEDSSSDSNWDSSEPTEAKPKDTSPSACMPIASAKTLAWQRSHDGAVVMLCVATGLFLAGAVRRRR